MDPLHMNGPPALTMDQVVHKLTLATNHSSALRHANKGLKEDNQDFKRTVSTLARYITQLEDKIGSLETTAQQTTANLRTMELRDFDMQVTISELETTIRRISTEPSNLATLPDFNPFLVPGFNQDIIQQMSDQAEAMERATSNPPE